MPEGITCGGKNLEDITGRWSLGNVCCSPDVMDPVPKHIEPSIRSTDSHFLQTDRGSWHSQIIRSEVRSAGALQSSHLCCRNSRQAFLQGRSHR
jgi:hypothetical protein